MSQANVDFVLAAYEWGNREQGVARDWWHPDGEYINSREDPDHATYRGIEAIEKLFASWIEAYPDVQIHPLEARASGDRVFVWSALLGMARRAECRSRWSWRTSSPWKTIASGGWRSTWTGPRPSKP
jgi:SnoaL-like domain